MHSYDSNLVAIRRNLRYFHFEKQGGKCAYCNCAMRKKFKQKDLTSTTLEHILPRCLGGPDWKINTIAICQSCNHGRGCQFLTKEQSVRIVMHKGINGLVPVVAVAAAYAHEKMKLKLAKMHFFLVCLGIA